MHRRMGITRRTPREPSRVGIPSTQHPCDESVPAPGRRENREINQRRRVELRKNPAGSRNPGQSLITDDAVSERRQPGSSPGATGQYIVASTRGRYNCHESVTYSQHLIVVVTSSIAEENNMSVPAKSPHASLQERCDHLPLENSQVAVMC